MPAALQNWHAGRVLFALARYFDWWQQRLIPEFEIDGGRADLVVVSKAGYATEIEIKVSRGDWEADGEKLKWMRTGWQRPHVARFFYAVPAPLVAVMPAWVPRDAGVLSVRDGAPGYDTVREHRAARRYTARKLTDDQLAQIERAYYYRYWRAHMAQQERRLHGSAA